MKSSKTKFAAASFGAALASLYSAPELCAQVDSVPNTGDLSFVPATVPFLTGARPSTNLGLDVVIGGLTNNYGYGAPVELQFYNSGLYGVAIQGASSFEILQPGDVFAGGGAGGLSIAPDQTGVLTVGFVFNGGVGYFRVDLGQPGDALVFLDGEVALSPDGNFANNDFTITIPGGDEILLGDVNLDGTVNFLDIAPFIDRLANSEFQAEADINEDGMVNFLDISPFIGTLNGSSPLMVNWSDSTGKPLERLADANGAIEQQLKAVELKLNDELVAALAQSNGSDLLLNKSEPACVGLAALALGAVGLRRRRKTAGTAA